MERGAHAPTPDGKVRYKVRIPQFSAGPLRVMAVAYKGRRFRQRPKQTMKHRRPGGYQRPALPRFLSPGDTIDVPVTLTNTTNTA